MRPAASLLYRIARIRRGGRKPTTQSVGGRNRTGFATDGWLIKQGRCTQTLRDCVASGENRVQSQCSERLFWLLGHANTVLQQFIRSNNPTPLPDGKVVLLLAKDRSNGTDWGMAQSQGRPCARVVFSVTRPSRCWAFWHMPDADYLRLF